MKTFVQNGEAIELVAPYDRLSGEGALVGSIFGVATVDVLSTATANFITQGVVTLRKTSAQAWTLGVLIYWDNTNKEATTAAAAGANKLIGVAAAVAANPSATGN